MTLDHRYNIAYWVDILTEQEFIKVARQYCINKGSGHVVVQWLYRLGLDYGKIAISYQEFEAYVTDRDNPPRNRNRRRIPRWSRVCAGPFREGTKYRKNTSHEKKEKSQKDIWREVSGLNRDKSRRHSWQSGRKATARKAANGAHRQWIRQMIKREKYDTFCDVDWKWFNDPWDWD